MSEDGVVPAAEPRFADADSRPRRLRLSRTQETRPESEEPQDGLAVSPVGR